MPAPQTVKLLSRSAIDDERWNAAVDRDESCLIYGLTWWLDAATDHRWNGLVLGDYEAVLPLPYSMKLGPARTIVRPPFTQQLGPFGTNDIGRVAKLLASIPRSLKTDLPLRHGVLETAIPKRFQLRERTNLVLPLDRPYEEVRSGYGKTLTRRLRKAGPVTLVSSHPEAIVDLYRRSSGLKAGLTKTHYTRVGVLMRACQERGNAIFASIVDQRTGQELGNGFFPTYRGRTVHLFPGTTELGYQNNGPMRLLDAVIAERCELDHMFDFEGSDLPGVAQFFQRFKPKRRSYYRLS